jgi:endonuclease YncB( thermonuclease family)
MSLYTYAARVERVIDGDSLVVSIDLGLDVWRLHERIRLAHLNAPALSTPEGRAAKAFLAGLLGPLPQPVTLVTLKDRTEHYGRYLGVLTTADGRTVNDALLAAGHATPYEGHGKAS